MLLFQRIPISANVIFRSILLFLPIFNQRVVNSKSTEMAEKATNLRYFVEQEVTVSRVIICPVHCSNRKNIKHLDRLRR